MTNFNNTTEQQTNSFFNNCKVMNFIDVKFFKSDRKNAKELKRLSMSLNIYEPLNLTNILEYYIMYNKQYKNLKIVISISQHFQGVGTQKRHIYINNFKTFNKWHTIEQFINSLVDACIVATNGESIKYLSGIHDNIIIRQLIKKNYHVGV